MANPEIFGDEKYRTCIELASNSKGTGSRFGAILVDGSGEITGRGYCRAVYHTSFPGGRIERVFYQGYANHAEAEAINDALMVQRPVAGAEIYVAGYFFKDKRLFLHDTFTCVRCAKVMDTWGIRAVFVPSTQGWVERPITEALIEAKTLGFGGKYEKRRNLTEGEFSTRDLSL